MSKQRLSRQRWRDLIEEQRTGGLSVQAFCKRHGLASSTFFNWSRRFKSEAPSSAADQTRAAPPPFVELEAPSASHTGEADDASATTSTIELVLPSGLVVRVRRGFDPRLLQQVVEALA